MDCTAIGKCSNYKRSSGCAAYRDKSCFKHMESEKAPASSSELEILNIILASRPHIEPFRSVGFINKDYDMGRIYVDLPIITAKRLMAKIRAIEKG